MRRYSTGKKKQYAKNGQKVPAVVEDDEQAVPYDPLGSELPYKASDAVFSIFFNPGKVDFFFATNVHFLIIVRSIRERWRLTMTLLMSASVERLVPRM